MTQVDDESTIGMKYEASVYHKSFASNTNYELFLSPGPHPPHPSVFYRKQRSAVSLNALSDLFRTFVRYAFARAKKNATSQRQSLDVASERASEQ